MRANCEVLGSWEKVCDEWDRVLEVLEHSGVNIQEKRWLDSLNVSRGISMKKDKKTSEGDGGTRYG